MKKLLIIFTLIIIANLSCDKEVDTEKCGCDGTKTEYIDNIFGLVIETDDGYEILTDEKGLLIPCSELTSDFKINFKPVTISGQVRFSCKEIDTGFKINPIEITSIELRNSNYDKTDITLAIIKSEDYGYQTGYGYYIEDTRTTPGTRVIQPFIPSISGYTTYDTQDKAIATGLLAIYIIRGGHASITPEILRYINVID